jgi:hypothetical protein
MGTAGESGSAPVEEQAMALVEEGEDEDEEVPVPVLAEGVPASTLAPG